MSLLREAVKNNKIEDVQELIANGIDINEVSVKINLQTALHLAAGHGYAQIAELLISNGAHIDAKDIRGATPLHYAVGQNQMKTTKLLIENGANIHAVTSYKINETLIEKTPLEFAALKCHTDIIRLLIEHKADINKVLLTTIYMQNSKAFECFLKAGVHVDTLIKDPYGKSKTVISLLCLTIRLNKTEMVEILLKNGATLKSKQGNILAYAIRKDSNMDIIKTLIKHGAKINLKTKRKDSPLHVAVKRQETEIVKVLLQNGAKVNAKDHENCTPLEHAIPSIDIAKLLLQYGANINVQDEYGSTLLHDAVAHFSERNEKIQEYIRFLILSGAPINLREDTYQLTPIESVLDYKRTGTFKLILYNQL